MIAEAKNERKADQANFIQPCLQAAPYAVNLEYRGKDVAANAAVPETEAEMFYVIDGAATLTTGRKLRDEKAMNQTNLSGTGIEALRAMSRKETSSWARKILRTVSPKSPILSF
jgi:hypothetical protein